MRRLRAIARPLSGLTLTLAGLALVPPVQSRPAQVLLMRHGHKDPAGHHYNLSPAGFQRAQALASVIPACFGTPTQITTFAFNPDTSKNARSYQTAVPLAVASGVNIRLDRTSLLDSKRSGQRLLQDLTEVCWFCSGSIAICPSWLQAWDGRRCPPSPTTISTRFTASRIPKAPRCRWSRATASLGCSMVRSAAPLLFPLHANDLFSR